MESYALLLAATLNAGTVLALAALGLLINEKAGIVNLGAEGMLLCSAIAGFATVVHTGSDWIGFAAGAGAGVGAAAAAHTGGRRGSGHSPFQNCVRGVTLLSHIRNRRAGRGCRRFLQERGWLLAFSSEFYYYHLFINYCSIIRRIILVELCS